ncbi:MAG: WS/DGAT domain-containing protein, partial [Caldimonas sp.]
WLISGLAALYGRSRIADWLRLANVTISNVPGSKVPVYLVGARMTDYYPLSIVVHGVALNITVQSHVDHLCFGLIACRRAVPDVHELGQQLLRAMELLRTLTGQPALAAPAREAAAEPAAVAASPAPPAAPARPKRARARRAPRLHVVAAPTPTSAPPPAKRKSRAGAPARRAP